MFKTIAILAATMTAASASDSMLRGNNDFDDTIMSVTTVMPVTTVKPAANNVDMQNWSDASPDDPVDPGILSAATDANMVDMQNWSDASPDDPIDPGILSAATDDIFINAAVEKARASAAAAFDDSLPAKRASVAASVAAGEAALVATEAAKTEHFAAVASENKLKTLMKTGQVRIDFFYFQK